MATRDSTLRQKLDRLRCRTMYGQDLVPTSTLLQELTKVDIETEILRNGNRPLSDRVIDIIWQRARKIFAIMVVCSRTDHIEHFIKGDQMQARSLDDLLPMDLDSLHDILKNDSAAKRFFRKQWAFCAPDFSQLVYPRRLLPEMVLPIMSEAKLDEGFFGLIYMVQFHPEYGPDHDDDTKQYVRKELDIHDSSYETEVAVLARLQCLNHPNILKLVACYTHKDKHNIILPYIKGGTLDALLKNGALAAKSHHDLLHLFSGLCSAVSALHEITDGVGEAAFKGLHSDLRPVNILFEEGRLILTDFGLSSIKPPYGESKTAYKPVPGFYQAPECADLRQPFKEYHYTRASDIWALGCMLTDIMLLLTSGSQALQSFQAARKRTIDRSTYYLYHDSERLVSAVCDVLQRAERQQSRPSLGQLAKLVTHMLEIDPNKRPTARLVTENMFRITVAAFGEVVEERFAKLTCNAAMVIETARFRSWMVHHDTILAADLTPTATILILNDIVSILHRLIHALSDIPPSLDKRESRVSFEVRFINTELFDLLPQAGQQGVITDVRSRALLLLEPENAATMQRPFNAIPHGISISDMYKLKQKYASLDQCKGPTTKRSWTEVPGHMKLRYTILRSIEGYNIAKVAGCGHPRLVLEEKIASYDTLHYDQLCKRLEHFCDLLCSGPPDNLRALQVYGLNRGSAEFTIGILYDLGEHNAPDVDVRNPVTLRTLLEIQDINRRPCLGTRIQLASQLADALLTFHDLEWYHKDFTSYNVIIPATEAFDILENLSRFRLGGFRHSRHANASRSDGPPTKTSQYGHDPRYSGRKGKFYNEFKPEYDYYSLGVLLTEIALWTIVDRLVESSAYTNNVEFSRELRKTIRPRLRFSMGDKYADSVMKCLDGTFGVKRSINDALALRSPFNEHVVTPLRELTASISVPCNSQSTAPESRKRHTATTEPGSQSSGKQRKKRLKPA